MALPKLPYPLPNKIFDAVIAAAVLISFYLYRWHPPKETFSELWDTVRERWKAWDK